jgi:hypothetical protein
VLDRNQVEAAVAFIRRNARLEGPELARVVGGYVLAEFFADDFEQFRRHSRSKPVSFRALAARLDLPFSAGRLCTLIRISHQLREMAPEVADGLTLSHHRALLPLDDTSLKSKLAACARSQKWTRSRLEAEVRPHLRASRAGRKPRSAVAHAVEKVAELAERIEVLSRDAKEVRQLGSDLQAISASLRQSVRRLDSVLGRLATNVDTVVPIDCCPGDIELSVDSESVAPPSLTRS